MKKGLLIFWLLTSSTSVLAYIDPGTGTAIAGSIWPFILMVLGAIGAFFIKYFFSPIKKTCVRVWSFLVKR